MLMQHNMKIKNFMFFLIRNKLNLNFYIKYFNEANKKGENINNLILY